MLKNYSVLRKHFQKKKFVCKLRGIGSEKEFGRKFIFKEIVNYLRMMMNDDGQ